MKAIIAAMLVLAFSGCAIVNVTNVTSNPTVQDSNITVDASRTATPAK